MLQKVGIISNYDKDVFGHFISLKNQSVLCIGFSEEEIDFLIAKYHPARIVSLTNWVDHQDSLVEKYELVIGDIQKRTVFEDNEFDSVLTLSVLEHLSDVEGAFLEIRRICKNNGTILHFFGPVWSSSYGHHLHIDKDDPNLNFALWSMPTHLHLLFTDQEIIDLYQKMNYSDDICNSVVFWIRKSPIINRLSWRDYLNLWKSLDMQVERIDLMKNEVPNGVLKKLKAQIAKEEDFEIYGAKVLFRNMKTS
jgi:SAM-dependent methyltransferase